MEKAAIFSRALEALDDYRFAIDDFAPLLIVNQKKSNYDKLRDQIIELGLMGEFEDYIMWGD